MEKDDNTLENAGEIGRKMADALAEKVIETIDGFPANTDVQRPAIARIIANSLYDYADESER